MGLFLMTGLLANASIDLITSKSNFLKDFQISRDTLASAQFGLRLQILKIYGKLRSRCRHYPVCRNRGGSVYVTFATKNKINCRKECRQ